jgi:molecular chaperone DnaK (HSP70)
MEAYPRASCTPQAPKDVDAVELLGGASRVPRLQAELVKALGGRQLDKCVTVL